MQQRETLISVERRDAIVAITMARPERRNALSLDMMRELTAAFKSVGSDAAARVVILRGEGAAFSAGHDLRELQSRDADAYREIFSTCVRLMETIHAVPQPVIAEVATIATAAGCQLVAACDLAVAAEEARFATPGVRIGLFCSTPMVPLSRTIGRKRAMEMLLTGDFIDARTALAWGLVNRVVPAAQLHEETVRWATQIAGSSGYVVGIGKRAFYVQAGLSESAAYDYSEKIMTENAQAADAQEGIDAFLQRRPAKWRNV